jgi:hypothetical protein
MNAVTQSPSPLLPLHTAGGYNEVRESDGNRSYYRDGVLHRLDGPATISRHGDQYWYRAGLRHRDDGPAITSRNDMLQFWTDGVRTA